MRAVSLEYRGIDHKWAKVGRLLLRKLATAGAAVGVAVGKIYQSSPTWRATQATTRASRCLGLHHPFISLLCGLLDLIDCYMRIGVLAGSKPTSVVSTNLQKRRELRFHFADRKSLVLFVAR